MYPSSAFHRDLRKAGKPVKQSLGKLAKSIPTGDPGKYVPASFSLGWHLVAFIYCAVFFGIRRLANI